METRRIHICGTSGCGKTTLAAEFARMMGARHIELDALWHRENWQTVPLEEFRRRVAEALAHERWVAGGNYAKVRDLVWADVDAVVWLDYSLPLILWRLGRRTLGRWYRREVLWHGNRERLWRHLLVPRDSLFWWVLTTYRRRRREYRALSADPARRGISFVTLRGPADTERWLASLRRTL